jgi:MFS family permease
MITKTTKPRIITRTVLLVSMVSFFTDIASEMLYPVMPVYLKTIGFSVVLIGVLEGFAEATAGLSKGYFGNLSDRLGQRLPFIKWGYLLSAFSKPMMALFTFPPWIFFARTTDRLGKGIRTGARDAMLSDESSAANKGKVFGFHRSLDTAGAAVGPMIALLYLAFFPGQYKWLFIIAFAPGVAAIAFTFLIKEKRREPTAKVTQVGFLSYFGYWKRSSPAFKRLVSGLLAFTLFNSSDAFLLLALKYQGLSDTMMIGVYIFYNLIYALLSYPIGILADRFGLKRILVAGLLIFAGVYTSMGFAHSLWQFGIIFSFYALYAAATEGVSKALISNIAAKADTATAIGFFTSFASIFTLLASSLSGLLWYHFGPQAMFLVSGTGVGCVVIYFAAMKYNEVKQVL